MANQRMRLKCDYCGSELGFAKRMGSGFYVASHIEGKIEKSMNDFFDAHEECFFGKNEEGKKPTWDFFSLSYEHERE